MPRSAQMERQRGPSNCATAGTSVQPVRAGGAPPVGRARRAQPVLLGGWGQRPEEHDDSSRTVVVVALDDVDALENDRSIRGVDRPSVARKPLCSSMPQVSTSRAPGDRSLKPAIRSLMASRPLKRPLVGYFLGPVEHPTRSTSTPCVQPVAGRLSQQPKRESARFTATAALTFRQAAKPTFELTALTVWRPYHRQDDGRWRGSVRGGPRGRRFPGA